jgi:hypothetical protein
VIRRSHRKISCGSARTDGIMTGVDPIQPLRILAIRQRLDGFVGSDQLIQAALDALLAGVDTPSLQLLAGLRAEEPQANGLFTSVIDELEFAPILPTAPTATRWELVRWWCQLIVSGRLPPEVGGRLIWDELDRPELPRLAPTRHRVGRRMGGLGRRLECSARDLERRHRRGCPAAARAAGASSNRIGDSHPAPG